MLEMDRHGGEEIRLGELVLHVISIDADFVRLGITSLHPTPEGRLEVLLPNHNRARDTNAELELVGDRLLHAVLG